MIWNAKNGTVPIGNTEMSYAAFGSGKKVLILLPGLSDGLTTVEGKALLLAAPYKLFFKEGSEGVGLGAYAEAVYLLAL